MSWNLADAKIDRAHNSGHVTCHELTHLGNGAG